MLYERFFRVLNAEKLNYLVAGGIAVNLHGFARATGDLDILISMTDEHVKKFVRAVKKLGLVPRIPVKIEDFADPKMRNEWARKKNMKVFSVYNPDNPMEHVDVMIHEVVDFDQAYENRVVMHARDLEIPVVGISDLVKMKKAAGRERDLIDIKALERLERIKDEK